MHLPEASNVMEGLATDDANAKPTGQVLIVDGGALPNYRCLSEWLGLIGNEVDSLRDTFGLKRLGELHNQAQHPLRTYLTLTPKWHKSYLSTGRIVEIDGLLV